MATSAFDKLRFPCGKLVGANRERDVHRSAAIMRRDRAAGHVHGLERLAAQEQQQQAAAADVVGAEPLIAIDAVEPEHLFVERAGALKTVDVEHGFQNAVQVRHGQPDTGTTSRTGAWTRRVTALAATTACCCA